MADEKVVYKSLVLKRDRDHFSNLSIFFLFFVFFKTYFAFILMIHHNSY